jgi:DNA-binding CsgD family transcriptional regulator
MLYGVAPSGRPIVNQQKSALNSRQAEILAMLCSGKRNKEIAYQLGLSERTVKWYISQLFLIFGVFNRTELVVVVCKDLHE